VISRKTRDCWDKLLDRPDALNATRLYSGDAGTARNPLLLVDADMRTTLRRFV